MNTSLLITNARLITASGVISHGWLLCREGNIAAMDSGIPPQFDNITTLDAQGYTLLPGFIDVHVHGAGNYEAMDASREALRAMAKFYAAHGVTSFLATTWTDSRLRIEAALQAIKDNLGVQPDGATILGAHLEGPYLNPEKCGAQNLTYIRRAEREEAEHFLDYGVTRLLAVAPEYPENHWLIETASKRGITVSAAHTSATYDDIRRAISLGLSQSTHTYNAMTGLHHREPGTLGAALTSPEIRCELIADNIHVHPAAMNLLWKAKGHDHVILISDAIRATGMPDGEYPIDERSIFVKQGKAALADGTLAGSTLTMDRAVANFMKATGEPLENIWQTSSLNAARAIHVDDRKGMLKVGYDADLVLVSDELEIMCTVVMGNIVHRYSKDVV